MADFFKIHAHLINQARNNAALERRPVFTIPTLVPCTPVVSEAEAFEEMDNFLCWSVDFRIDYIRNMYAPTPDGLAGIRHWTEKYGKEPDWKWEIPEFDKKES